MVTAVGVIAVYMLIGLVVDFSRFFSWWKKESDVSITMAVRKYFEYFSKEHVYYWATAPIQEGIKLFYKLIRRG